MAKRKIPIPAYAAVNPRVYSATRICDHIFNVLAGKDVALRRKYIHEHALKMRNMDVQARAACRIRPADHLGGPYDVSVHQGPPTIFQRSCWNSSVATVRFHEMMSFLPL